MADNNSIGPKIVVEGEKEFKNSMADIRSEFKELDSEMKLAVSQFAKNDKSTEALTAQNKILGKEIDLQKTRISTVSTQYDKHNAALVEMGKRLDATKKAFADDSAEVIKAQREYDTQTNKVRGLQTELNKATTELNKFERELSDNNTTISTSGKNLDTLGKSSESAGTRIGAMGGKMSNAGGSMTTGITLPAAAAVVGLSALVMKSVSTADEIQRLSDVSGISAERLQELSYAGSALGVDLTTITGAQAKLTKSMAGATDGTGTQAEAFATLGISILDSNGNMRDANTVMMESFDALNGVGNETERDAIAMAIFGKSAMELNPLIKAGADGLKELTDEAAANGAVISNEGVAALDTFGDSLDAMGLSIMGAAGSVAADFTPTLQSLSDVVKTDIVPGIAGMVTGAGNLIVGFTKLDPTLQKIIIGTAGLAIAAGPLLTVGGSLTTIVGGVATALTTATGAIGVMATGATAATPAVAGLAGAVTTLWGPVGVIIAAVGALAVTGVILHDVVSKGTQLTNEQTKANDAYISSSEAVATSIGANVTARTESIKTTQDEAFAASDLSTKIFDLADKQNKSAWELQLLNSYVTQFNTLMPNANLLIDEQTGALNLTREATTELIAAETERIRLQAVNEALVQNAKDQLATKREMNEAQIRQNQLETEYSQGMQAVIDGEGNKNEKQQKANELWAKYQEQLGPVTESVTTLTAKQADLTREQGTLNGILADPSGWDAYINGTNTAGEATVTFADGTTKTLTELGTTAPLLATQTGEKTATGMATGLTTGVPGVTASAQAIHDTVKTTTDPLTPELTTTGTDATTGAADAMTAATPKVTTAAVGIHDTAKNTTDPLVSELTTTGGSSGQGLGAGLESKNSWVGINAALLHNTTKNTIDPLTGELSKTGADSGQGFGDALGGKKETVGVSAQSIYDTTTGKFTTLPGVIGGYGGDSGQGYADGLKGKEGEIENKSNSMVQKVLSVFRKGLGINSPSTEFRELGAFSMDGYLDGLIKNAGDVAAFCSSIVEDIKSAFANKKFSLTGAIDFIGTGAAEFLKSIGIGGASLSGLQAPVSGAITSGFGGRDSFMTDSGEMSSSYHGGLDIGAAEGTPVGAAGAGEVTQAGWYGGYGNAVHIDHGNGLETLYGHLSAVAVAVGAMVSAGEIIGAVGSTGNSTGPHLHFGIFQNGEAIDPSSLYGFDVGSRYVPQDMVAMVHQGEMIIPKSENPYANSGGQITPNGATIEQTVNIYSPQALSPGETARLNKRAMQELAMSF